ncbi:MAG: 4'-phosphopantetheinyl transferase superfamily protein [bacterium]|nr:4'-phosphopantetheinyl transferase superfamily protein [bacterium]
MNTVYWLTRSEGDLPAGAGWLAAAEVAVIAGLTVPSRRRDWLLGRWAAKQALASWSGLSGRAPGVARLEIRAAADGAPEAFLNSERLPVSLSISHSGGRALCALSEGAAVGCDLERIEARSELFVLDYFTHREQVLVASWPESDRPLVDNLVWSAKESALKALRVGLRADTRGVEVSLPGIETHDGWRRLEVRQARNGQSFEGWWRAGDGYVMTFASPGRLEVPERLAG